MRIVRDTARVRASIRTKTSMRVCVVRASASVCVRVSMCVRASKHVCGRVSICAHSKRDAQTSAYTRVRSLTHTISGTRASTHQTQRSYTGGIALAVSAETNTQASTQTNTQARAWRAPVAEGRRCESARTRVRTGTGGTHSRAHTHASARAHIHKHTRTHACTLASTHKIAYMHFEHTHMQKTNTHERRDSTHIARNHPHTNQTRAHLGGWHEHSKRLERAIHLAAMEHNRLQTQSNCCSTKQRADQQGLFEMVCKF
jgi:hypothetical protein